VINSSCRDGIEGDTVKDDGIMLDQIIINKGESQTTVEGASKYIKDVQT
jgi:hypothetical protein